MAKQNKLNKFQQEKNWLVDEEGIIAWKTSWFKHNGASHFMQPWKDFLFLLLGQIELLTLVLRLLLSGASQFGFCSSHSFLRNNWSFCLLSSLYSEMNSMPSCFKDNSLFIVKFAVFVLYTIWAPTLAVFRNGIEKWENKI